MNSTFGRFLTKFREWKGTHEDDWDAIRFFVIVAAVMFLIVRPFIVQPFIVDGRSMAPTFDTNDYLLVDKISPRFTEFKRGDVVVFLFPNKNKDPRYANRYFIKRIIGLPGEEVKIDGDSTTIVSEFHPDGMKLSEPYVTLHALNISVDKKLGANEYFVMGDNRAESYDSRYWGPLEENFISGRAFLRLFPLTGIGIFPGNFHSY